MNNDENSIIIKLHGRIDSENAAAVENDFTAQLAGCGKTTVVFDAADLAYVSSAGLRVILRIKKSYGDVRIINVNSEIYDIFEMTGFTEMMRVEKAYRVVSVENCEVIGEGFNGKVYRIDKDNVVKTYKNADALAEIQHEREVARLALVLGVPTAISYDVVRVGDSYGSVFELLNAKSFAKILATEPQKMSFCVKEYVKMLKRIHGITVPQGKLPDAKQKILKVVSRIKDRLPDGLGDKLLRMVENIPDSDRMIHGDCHTKNIVLADDEVLLIDMDTLSVGHPIFEFLYMYNAYVGYSEYDPSIVLGFQGYPAEISRKFWHDTLAAYFGTQDEEKLREIDEKIRCVAYPYLIDWKARHGDDGAEDKATVALWQERLTDILGRVDDLCFDVEAAGGSSDEIEVDAKSENLAEVTDFVTATLDRADCPPKARMQVELAVEEIFVNVAHYAYPHGNGKVTVKTELTGDPIALKITFIDRGVPYDPLAKKDPDTTLSAQERQIGGLGIFMTKKITDDISYEYKNGQNVLTIVKILQ